MYHKIALDVFLIAGLALLQSAFIAGLPLWLTAVDLGVISLIFLLSLSSFNRLLIWAIGLGYLLDVFSFYPFGANIISLFFTALFSYLVFTYLLTNRSLYSFLALTVFAVIIKEFIFYFYLYLFEIFSGHALGLPILGFIFFKYKSIGLVGDLIIVLVSVNIINFFSHRLKPVFIAKSKS